MTEELKENLIDEKSVGEFRPQEKTAKTCNFTPVVLMIALSVHSFFEGLATGMTKDMQSFLSFLVAIFLHKWAAAMSLGISLARTFEKGSCMIYLLIFIFSIATPIGVGVGMIIAGSSLIVDIIFSSMAGGTFLYIACTEVIVEEFSVPKCKLLKILMFIVGAVIITVIG